MKKFITILAIMMVVVGSVFALTGDKLTVTASVTEVKPEFTMVGGETNAYGTTATNTIASEKNIATTPIDIYVKISQTAKSYFKSTSGFDLTVQATALSATIEGVAYSTAVPTIAASSDGNAIANATDSSKNDFVSTKKSATDGTVVFTIKYPTGAPVDADTEVGTIQYKWPATSTLAVGDYSATITMTYTAQ